MKILRRFLINTLFIFTMFLAFNMKVEAKSVNVYMFYGKTCPHCEEALNYLNSIKDKYNLKIYSYEVWYDSDNKKIMNNIANFLDVNIKGVPFAIIDNTSISGYTDGITDETYRYHIKNASKEDFIDKVGMELGVVEKAKYEENKDNNKDDDLSSYIIKIPILGKVDLKKISLPVVAILIGAVDGFNPCAMWVLLFLISTLIGMKDKKRLWAIGLTFLISSSFVYLAFMVSWLEFAKMINGVVLVRTLIAIVAIIGGAINLNNFINSIGKDDGCDVINAKKRKKIFTRIKNFTHSKSFIIAIFGTIFLAISVNLIELACSAGLPVIFTQLLAMNNLSNIQYALYIIIYIFFFMLDDLIIFAISIKTMELTGISTKYSKYSHLIGGILMLLIGILLIIKPEWLMFNF